MTVPNWARSALAALAVCTTLGHEAAAQSPTLRLARAAVEEIAPPLSPSVYIPRPPPSFNVVLSEPSIEILDQRGTAYRGGKRELGLRAVYGRGFLPLASAPWN